MPHITVAQFFILLFLSRLYTFFTVLPGLNEGGGGNGTAILAGLPVFALLAFASLLPGWLLARRERKPDSGVLECAYRRSKTLGVVSAVVFGALALFTAVDSAVHFEVFITTVVYPEAPTTLFVCLFVATCAYLVLLGIEPCARFSWGVLVFLLLSLVLIALSLTQEFDSVGLVSPFIQGLAPVGRSAAATWGETGELALILLFIPFLRGNVKRGFVWWIVAVCLALGAMVVITLSTVGAYAVTQTFPIYAVAKMARLFYFQRMDAVHMVIWTMMGVLKTTLYLYAARHCFSQLIFGRARHWLLWILAVLLAGGTVLLSLRYELFAQAYRVLASGVPLLVAVVGVPLLILLFPKRRVKEKK